MVTLLSPMSHALIVGSYNVRYSNDQDVAKGNGWEQRAPVVAGLIRFHDFDVIGTQEALGHQISTLQQLLPDYDYRGVGRDDGHQKGEYAAIFYKKTKFLVMDSGTFWLSATPTVPSIGWDAERSRVCTWVKFKAVTGGDPFFAFNTHFDHRGRESRVQSVQLVLSAIKRIAGSEKSFLTGDFNFDQLSDGYESILAPGNLFDSFTTVGNGYSLNGTTNGFKIHSRSDARIDHIFHTRGFRPRRYGILTDSYRILVKGVETESGVNGTSAVVKPERYEARLPSDHFPVLVEFESDS